MPAYFCFKAMLPFLCADRTDPKPTLPTPGPIARSHLAPRGTALGASPCLRAPKDFGIKFLNLECEFLRHEMYSECGFLGLTRKQLWEGTPRTLLGLALELGPRRHFAPSAGALSWPGPLPDPSQAGLCPAAQTKPSSQAASSALRPGQGPPPTPAAPPTARTPLPNLVPITLLRSHHHPGTGQSQLTQSS